MLKDLLVMQNWEIESPEKLKKDELLIFDVLNSAKTHFIMISFIDFMSCHPKSFFKAFDNYSLL